MKRNGMDSQGGMEGIPLQLVIVIVIGVAALGVLLGWLAMAGDPDPTLDNIDVEPEDITLEGDGRITGQCEVRVYVYDSEGNEVDGVVVTFSGAVEEEVVEKIDSGDSVELSPRLIDGMNTDTIDVTAEKGDGKGKAQTTIIVMRG
ncbi:MAG: hypothetical protein ACMUIG_08435 [Thermoplasmatota archaeon]